MEQFRIEIRHEDLHRAVNPFREAIEIRVKVRPTNCIHAAITCTYIHVCIQGRRIIRGQTESEL